MDPTARLLAACRRQPVDRPPIWIMRQAGRYMPSYREVRKRVSFMELCRTPEIACEVTMMPIDQLGLDAAILFSDILVPLESMGQKIYFDKAGPHCEPAVRSAADIDKLTVDGAVDGVSYVYDAVSLIKKTLNGRAPLLGFAGAPLTLATYAIEGGTSKHKHEIRRLIYTEPAAMHRLLDKLATVITEYLRRQIQAGADAVQLFDTWGGMLTEAEWRTFSMPYTARIMEGIADLGAPILHYCLGSAHLTPALAELPCDVLSVDWRQSLSSIREATGGRYALQGNIEAGILRAEPHHIEAAAKACLDDYGTGPGHIVNLGHGITPDVSVAAAKHLVECVQRYGRERAR